MTDLLLMTSQLIRSTLKQGMFYSTLLCIFIAMAAVPAIAAKHAVLVYDTDTRQVIYHENGHAKRYPASLTKMMTLYLLFEQMREGKISPNTKMKASSKAASQPQTNISLRTGDRLTVDQAVRALVVRSANDVAVVVAEHIGGSEAQFARMATRKSRALGMRNTYFKNPHGLPNSKQTTTAMDMALLGTALRRDFPQYYHYFSTRKFSYKGKHFKSHNRVLDKLPGVDGIKTGYIRASGFNVVSSLKHGGSNIVAVVMGGKTSKDRDARMVSLLRETHTKLSAKRGRGAFRVAQAPLPMPKPKLAQTVAVAAQVDRIAPAVTIEVATPKPVAKPVTVAKNVAPNVPSVQPMRINDDDQPTLTLSAADKPKPSGNSFSFSLDLGGESSPPDAPQTVAVAALDSAFAAPESAMSALRGAAPNAARVASPVPRAKPVIATIAPRRASESGKNKNTLDYQLATLSQEFPVPRHIFAKQHSDPGKDWAVQIGIYHNTLDARRALSHVARSVKTGLNGAIADVEYANQSNQRFHRARLKNLTRANADAVCQSLRTMRQDCFVTKLN